MDLELRQSDYRQETHVDTDRFLERLATVEDSEHVPLWVGCFLGRRWTQRLTLTADLTVRLDVCTRHKSTIDVICLFVYN